jgi:hypothetical protein
MYEDLRVIVASAPDAEISPDLKTREAMEHHRHPAQKPLENHYYL